VKSRIDWESLARQLGTLSEDGREHGGARHAIAAITVLIGADKLRDAVDWILEDRPGSELARAVLAVLNPWSAMERCYEVYRAEPDHGRRCSALLILKAAADYRALGWIPILLSDPDENMQALGIDILDQMIFGGNVEPDECEQILSGAAQHENPWVRKRVSDIEQYLKEWRDDSGLRLR